MKIMFIITGLGMGGAETQICNLIDQLALRGYMILLISLTGKSTNKPKNKNVQIVELKMSKNPLALVKAYFEVARILQQFQPDVVHSHMIHANIFARLLRVVFPISRLICTAHSKYEGGKIRMLAYRLTERLCDMTTNVSQEAVDEFIRLGAVKPEKITPVYNGIDVDKFSYSNQARNDRRLEIKVNQDDVLLLSVGRLTEAKDYPNLLNALPKLIVNNPSLKLVIIGDGEQRKQLELLIDHLALNEHVVFLGLRHDVFEWMSAADIFVLSSSWEGFGLVVAEAMACQRVVVATDSGGVKEVLGDAGILVPRKDSTALAMGISKALSMTSDEKWRLGAMSRERVINNYSLNAAVTNWIRLYKGEF